MTLDELLICWVHTAIRRQRGITMTDLAQAMAVSKTRVSQLLDDGGHSSHHLFRIDEALTRITEERHATAHRDDDPNCGVYTAVGEPLEVATVKGVGMTHWIATLRSWFPEQNGGLHGGS